MKVSAIVYTSATGFTARYARALARETGLPCVPLESSSALARGEKVLCLGWLCAGRIKGLRQARARFRVAAVGAVGMAPHADTAKLASDNALGDTPLFYLRGGYAPRRLPLSYRLMMVPMARMISRRSPKDEQERAMQDAFAHGGDWVSQAWTAPILAWLTGEAE